MNGFLAWSCKGEVGSSTPASASGQRSRMQRRRKSVRYAQMTAHRQNGLDVRSVERTSTVDQRARDVCRVTRWLLACIRCSKMLLKPALLRQLSIEVEALVERRFFGQDIVSEKAVWSFKKLRTQAAREHSDAERFRQQLQQAPSSSTSHVELVRCVVSGPAWDLVPLVPRCLIYVSVSFHNKAIVQESSCLVPKHNRLIQANSRAWSQSRRDAQMQRRTSISSFTRARSMRGCRPPACSRLQIASDNNKLSEEVLAQRRFSDGHSSRRAPFAAATTQMPTSCSDRDTNARVRSI